MKQTPLVSIIIPTYNRAHLIGETLDSVLAQTYTNWECIVVDDGSTDDTNKLLVDYCKKDARFQYHHRPNNRPKGANACRNYGFKLSKGEYVNWFDDDDIMLEDFLKFKVECFSSKINFVICTGYKTNKDLNIESKINLDLKNKSDLYQEYVMFNLKVLTPSILFNRLFLKENKLFKTSIFRGQETELFSRLFFKQNAENYIIVDKPLFLYRFHEMNKTFKNKNYHNSFKESESYIFVENLKKSLLLKSEQPTHFCYKQLVLLFFKSIVNNHNYNSKFILKNIISILKDDNKILVLKWLFLGHLAIIIKKRSYKIKKTLLESKIFFN